MHIELIEELNIVINEITIYRSKLDRTVDKLNHILQILCSQTQSIPYVNLRKLKGTPKITQDVLDHFKRFFAECCNESGSTCTRDLYKYYVKRQMQAKCAWITIPQFQECLRQTGHELSRTMPDRLWTNVSLKPNA